MSRKRIYLAAKVSLTLHKSNPPRLEIKATGTTRTAGWKQAELIPWIYAEPPPDGVYNFDFVARSPSRQTAHALTPIVATHTLAAIPRGLKGVRVFAETNQEVGTFGVR